MSTPAPESVKSRLQELNDLCERNPLTIPVNEAAAFLHTHPDSLRKALEQNQNLFGYGWQQNIRGNRAFCIPTLTFWFWCTKGMIPISVDL